MYEANIIAIRRAWVPWSGEPQDREQGADAQCDQVLPQVLKVHPRNMPVSPAVRNESSPLFIPGLISQKGPPSISKGTSGDGKGPVPACLSEQIANQNAYRASTLLTVIACQRPPRAVGMPRITSRITSRYWPRDRPLTKPKPAAQEKAPPRWGRVRE